jgi:ATP synthase subunit 6
MFSLTSCLFFSEKYFFFFDIIFFTKLEKYILIVFLLILFLFLIVTRNLFLIPSIYQFILESIYDFLSSTINQQAGKVSQRYFPFFLVLFLFILFSNLIGLVPFSFTVTSHIFQTFFMGFSIIVALTIIGFLRHKIYFLKLFFPSGAPIFLAPLLIVIEIISYVSRAFSLSIRLFANMMSGHTLLNIIASFSVKIFNSLSSITFNSPFSILKALAGFIPMFMIGGILLLEMGIAILQAYVFIVLVSIYLNDSIKGGH